MCNFYIMYYMNATLESQRGETTCTGNHEPQMVVGLPLDADEPLPPNPALEDVAMGHHHHAMKDEGRGSTTGATPTDQGDTTPARPLNSHTGKLHLASDTHKSNRVGAGRNGLLASKSSSKGPADLFDRGYDRLGADRLGLSNVNERDYSLGEQRPYFLDYPNYDDYDYDVLRQRNRNRSKKPSQYDWYDAGDNLGFSDFSKTYPSLSRNRNKIFNNKYDEYATSDTLDRKSGRFGSLVPGQAPSSMGRKPGPADRAKGDNSAPVSVHTGTPDIVWLLFLIEDL